MGIGLKDIKLRYIQNLITEGDIYSWSMDNGYWSDYKTAIRYYNDAQKYTDFQLYPDLASTLLNRIGSMYFKNGDYKTCITHFDLALYYAKKTKNLDFISDNHIMLARASDAIEKWKEATKHYELHAAYKDTIIQNTENERTALEALSINIKKENLKVEQTLDMIETQERQELVVAQKELRNIALENELELYRQDAALKGMLIQNQKLAEENATRNYLLTKEQLEKVFSNHGVVKEVKIIEGRGFGFVEMSSPAEAEKAKEALNGSEFEGQTLKVDEAHPPKNGQRRDD